MGQQLARKSLNKHCFCRVIGGPRYSLISDLGQGKAGRGGRGGAWQRYRRPALVVGCVALQTLLTSVVWNYLVIHYHMLLERAPAPAYSPPAAAAQAAVLRSGSTSFGNKAVFILCGVNTKGQGGAILFGFQHAAKCERRCDIPQFTFTVHTDLPRPPILNYDPVSCSPAVCRQAMLVPFCQYY